MLSSLVGHLLAGMTPERSRMSRLGRGDHYTQDPCRTVLGCDAADIHDILDVSSQLFGVLTRPNCAVPDLPISVSTAPGLNISYIQREQERLTA